MLRDGGFKASEMVSGGCDTAELKEAGYPAKVRRERERERGRGGEGESVYARFPLLATTGLVAGASWLMVPSSFHASPPHHLR